MNTSKSIIYAFIFFVMIAIAGASLTAFQHWLQQPHAFLEASPVIPVVVPAIVSAPIYRHSLSTTEPLSATSPLSYALPSSGIKTPVAKSLSTHHFDESDVTQVEYEAPIKSAPLFKFTPEGELIKKGVHKEETAPSMVIFDHEIIIEFPIDIATENNVKSAIYNLLLSGQAVEPSNLLEKKRFNLKEKPYFYRHIVDQQNEPIRYPKQAYAYADYLIKENTEYIQDVDGEFLLVSIPRVAAGLTGGAKPFQTWVNDYSSEFDIAPALVYAIMETESAFNPEAVSASNAIGLMQIKPESAGRDVYKLVDGRLGQPSINALFNSENNIRMGTAYLSLLKHEYLADVENEKIKNMMAISSYNGGMSAVMALFGENARNAIEKVNRMRPQQVYRALRYDHKSGETRRYLEKVLNAETKYKKLLEARELNV